MEDIAAWLKVAPRSVATPIRYNAQPDRPDAVITIGDTGGYGTETEDGFDNPTFQVRCRGPSMLDARDTSFYLDDLFLSEGSFLIGNTYVLKIERVGGRPAYLATDERGRTTYTANYSIKSER